MHEKLLIQPEYPYVYETHLHTKEASACAHNSGAEMARALKEAGYSGFFVTDHFVGGNTAIDRKLPWEDWVEGFCKGYEHAKEEGDRIGIDVFFGWESGFNATEFLVYGLDKQWLLAHPELQEITVKEQYALVHAGGGMVIQCHPFRDEAYVPHIRLFPHHVDGVEVVNATHCSHLSHSHNNPLFDTQARVYAECQNLPVTAGSDVHSVDLLLGGMAFPHRLKGPEDYIAAVKNREPYLLLSGNENESVGK